MVSEEKRLEKRTEGEHMQDQDVQRIDKEEVMSALKKIQSGKVVDSDGIPVKARECLGELFSPGSAQS